MMQPEVRTFRSAADLNIAAANLFVNLSDTAIHEKGTFFVALSGGSTPKALYELLASPEYTERIRWNNIYFFWGDERFVPHSHPESNFKMAQEAMLSRAPVPVENIFRVPTENISPGDAALQYEETLRQRMDRFDLVLLGLGEDGHTASLFPYTKALNEKERWVIENYVEKLNAYRISFTFRAINDASNVVFLVAGESKTKVLKQVLDGPREPQKLPAQQVQPSSGKLLFLVAE